MTGLLNTKDMRICGLFMENRWEGLEQGGGRGGLPEERAGAAGCPGHSRRGRPSYKGWSQASCCWM